MLIFFSSFQTLLLLEMMGTQMGLMQMILLALLFLLVSNIAVLCPSSFCLLVLFVFYVDYQT